MGRKKTKKRSPGSTVSHDLLLMVPLSSTPHKTLPRYDASESLCSQKAMRTIVHSNETDQNTFPLILCQSEIVKLTAKTV
jgi:hypothetical protein